jgi:hypothetical protein
MANLITLTEYKTAQGINSTQHDDALNALIDSISQLVKTYCGHAITDYYSTNKVETISINWNTPIAQLTESPVNTIVTVEERDSLSSSYVTLTANEDYFFDSNLDVIYRTTSSGNYMSWKVGPGSVRVTYTAGYETCPEDLKLAVIDLVTYYHKDEYKPRQTLSGATRENAASGDTKGFPDHIKRILDLYKTY